MTRSWLLFPLLLFALDARGQDRPGSALDEAGDASALSVTLPAPGPGSTFRSGVDLVALNVVVTDAKQKFVTDLGADDFHVYEDGVRQNVSFFAASEVPLDLAILLDTSASMSDKMHTVQQAAIGFAGSLKPGDRVAVVDIKDGAKMLHPLTADVEAAAEAIRGTRARGGTALYNGLYLTLKELVKGRRTQDEVRRQAIVVLSDGDDTSSLLSFDDVMATAKESGISIYTITLKSAYLLRQAAQSGRRYFSQSEYSMKALAQETGARAFFPTELAELTGVYSSIAEELSTQYSIGYSPKNPRRDGSYRRVVVRIDRPNVLPRTRSGYAAPKTAPGLASAVESSY